MNWNVSLWRGPEELYEEWEPIDARAAAEVIDTLPGAERIDDTWTWDGPGGLGVTITLYSMTDETPINELGLSVLFPPEGTAGKRSDLRVLGEIVFEAAARTGTVVGELGHGTFANVDEFVRRGLRIDPWPSDEPPPPAEPARTHVTRSELFKRLLHRD